MNWITRLFTGGIIRKRGFLKSKFNDKLYHATLITYPNGFQVVKCDVNSNFYEVEPMNDKSIVYRVITSENTFKFCQFIAIET